jgi:ATP-binding cassette subfamily B protein/subfamily B ATP-binding cassette protein MsbA
MSRHWLIQALRFYREDWWRVLVAVGFLAVTTTAAVLKPWPIAWIVDLLTRRDEGGSAGGAEVFRVILAFTGYLAGLHLLHALGNAALQAVVISTGLRGLTRVRQAVFDRLLGLSLRRLHGSRAGDLIYRATWDTYSIQTLFNQGVFTVLTASAGVVTMTVVMWRMNRMMTLVALATVPFLVGVIRLLGPRLSREAASAQKADAGIASSVQQLVANLQLVQVFTRERRESAAFADRAGEAFQARWRQHRIEVLYLALVAAVLAGGTAAILAAGSREVLDGRLSTGRLLVFLAYLTQLYEPLNQLSHVGGTVSNARAGAERVLELLHESPGNGDGTRTPSPAEGVSLDLDSVCFGYEPSRRVLDGVSLHVAAGQTVAIIGPSGSGKTTLVQLVPRFLEPDSGSILWNGEPLRDLRRSDIRRSISLVLQEPLLLPATVAENIGFAREGATRAEIEAAAVQANAQEFIARLPQGFDTVVGDGAARLSTGEKQRINLARAFLKDAPVLLLDEPTSALDRESEIAVVSALRRLAQGRTTFIVAHRLETVRHADRIVVLKEGRVVEQGSPDDLIAAGGYFARMSQGAPPADSEPSGGRIPPPGEPG